MRGWGGGQARAAPPNLRRAGAPPGAGTRQGGEGDPSRRRDKARVAARGAGTRARGKAQEARDRGHHTSMPGPSLIGDAEQGEQHGCPIGAREGPDEPAWLWPTSEDEAAAEAGGRKGQRLRRSTRTPTAKASCAGAKAIRAGSTPGAYKEGLGLGSSGEGETRARPRFALTRHEWPRGGAGGFVRPRPRFAR